MAIGAKESLQNLTYRSIPAFGQQLRQEQQGHFLQGVMNGPGDEEEKMRLLIPLLGTVPQAASIMQGLAMQKEINTPKIQFAPPGSTPFSIGKEGKITQYPQITPKATTDQWQPVTRDAQGLPVTQKRGNQNGYWTKHIVGGVDTGERKWESQGTESMMAGQEQSFDDFRKTPEYQDAIKSIADGSNKLSTVLSGRYSTPQNRMKVVSDVKKVNSDYKEYTYDNDRNFKLQYQPAGRVGQKIANLNTAIEHTGELLENVNQLGNDQAQLVNSVKNWFAQTFGTERAVPLNSFEAVKSALSGELGSLFKGGNAAATDPEIDNISKVISSSQNPDALKQALMEYLRVGKQRIDQYSIPYNERFAENQDFLNPHPRQLLQEFGILAGQNGGMNLDMNEFDQWLKDRNKSK